MISKNHYIELYINNQPIEITSQDSLNLRLNNVLFKPTETSTKQGEYSYSFEIPSTPNNDKVFDYANNLSKLNKFHTRYSAQVYADGHLIFDGSLTIQKYDAKERMYTCNLVNIKIYGLEDIFGEDVLTDVKWLVDFYGSSSINSVNADTTSKYCFPLISYGSFAKVPISADTYGVQDEYTSKYVIDDTNRFRIDSFYPSLNMLEEVKKCFEHKGYKVGGNAFYDPIISNIFCSTNLADEQDPIYNVGYSKFGALNLHLEYDSDNANDESNTFTQSLKFPYMPASEVFDAKTGLGVNNEIKEVTAWNFDEVFLNSLLSCGDVRVAMSSTMYEPNNSIIVIPADGFYKISMSGNIELKQTSAITANQIVYNKLTSENDFSWKSQLRIISPNIKTTMPIEIQLVKNYDENLELIKGKWNFFYRDGDSSHATYKNEGRYPNYVRYKCCYPHERDCYFYTTDYSKISDSRVVTKLKDFYIQGNNETMTYDPIVSDAFICGWSTIATPYSSDTGTVAFIKNGYSWSKTRSSRTDALYVQNGYFVLNEDANGREVEERTNHNYNELVDAPTSYYSQSGNTVQSGINGVVYLHKGDKLEIMGVRRAYWDGEEMKRYDYEATINLSITAVSQEKNIYGLRAKNYNWYSQTDFPYRLNLMNFTNNETKISDWLKNVSDAFNLEYVFTGMNVDINVNKGIKKTIAYAVDIDDRVNSDEAESEIINYPREMSVRYKIDTDEHGFYESVPQEHINDENWKDYGDSGFTIIKLNDDSYETSNQNKSTQFGYTWYDNFQFSRSGQTEVGISMPVISREEYMIDNYDYEDSMAHRGYSLPQRFWFRTGVVAGTVALENDYNITQSGFSPNRVVLYGVKNQKDGVNLSYKDTETSLVTEYFNVHPMLSSNYVNVDVYLTPEEYKLIKDGAMVKFDSNLHFVSEIQGYDVTGNNPTTLKLITKV